METKQREIIEKYGINPTQGLLDLKKVTSAYRDSPALIQLLLYAALKEEDLITRAVGTKESTLTEDQKKFMEQMDAAAQKGISPVNLQLPSGYDAEKLKEIDNDPAKRMEFQFQLQQQFMKVGYTSCLFQQSFLLAF